MSACKVKLPANSREFFEKILGIVTFDIIPEEIYGPVQEYLLDDLPSDYFFHE